MRCEIAGAAAFHGPESAARSLMKRLAPILHALALTLSPAPLGAELLDTLVFGDAVSERAHGLVATHSDSSAGGLGEPSRRLLPGGDPAWQGGRVKFALQVDPAGQNYFTLRLWGGDVSRNQLMLHVDGKQVGYRHLGDHEALDVGTDAPPYPGRFSYRTCPIPRSLTTGKETITCEIRASGPIWGYGRHFDDYQKPMTAPTRGLYRAYTHTDPCLDPPAGEKQGVDPAAPPVRGTPGPEVMKAVEARVDGEIERLLRMPDQAASQMQALFLAKAWHTPWTRAAGDERVIRKVLATLDALYRGYVANPDLARAEPSTWNPDWFGLGPSGQIIGLLKTELAPHFDTDIENGASPAKKVKRRDGYAAMLLACREIHRENRRQYTNQTMIIDLYGIYLANRGLAVVAPSQALPEMDARRYLHEAVGLRPWWGAEVDGVPQKPLGDAFFQITAKGLTRELGFVGNYGEVQDWVAQIYESTRPAPGQAGDAEILRQLVKIGRARAPFRYPMLDRDGHRTMVQETIVGWRDTHVPGDTTYAQRPSWDGMPFEAAAVTLDPHSVGYCQQMLDEGQFWQSVKEKVDEPGFRTTFCLLGVPESYERIASQPRSPHRLPMSWDQPDFVFSDEENGVVAVKQGREILYASLYWRARYGVNFLARVHHLAPGIERAATVVQEVEFTPSGMEYVRPDWTNFGFGNGGHRYPADYVSAHAGEKLPIARIPADVKGFKPGQENIHAGRGDLYQLRYGAYFIAMNMSADRSFEVMIPAGAGSPHDLARSIELRPGEKLKLAPRTTLVLHFR
jgi:hypothetical protein